MNEEITLDNLNVSSFHAEIDKLPFFNYKLKSVDIPSVTNTPVEVPTPLQKMNVAGDTVVYSPVNFTFIVDENLYNYCSIFNWISGLGFPDSFDQFRTLISDEVFQGKKASYTIRETSDLTVHLLTNHKNTNRIVKFYNAFPTNLGGIILNNSNADSMVIEANVEFVFTGMQFIL